MSKFLVIGDVHGKINEYSEILQKHKPEYSIQIGDFGFKTEHEWFLKNIDCWNNKINFGNHDDYSFVSEKYSLGNYTYFHGYTNELMTVRGADSIDKQYRIEGISWWRNEELSYQEMDEAVSVYFKNRPSIMITHDAPQSIRKSLFGINDASITSQGLQTMLDFHKPKLWIFGHHHKSVNVMINNTKFVCLNELETLELEI